MTAAAIRTAIARLGQFAIGADAGLRVQTPEKAVIACRYRRIGLGQNELALPAQRGAQVRIVGIEAFRFLDQFLDHAAPPDAAFKMARLTATFASFTLKALWLSGLALLRAASAALWAVSLLTGLPIIACSASGE